MALFALLGPAEAAPATTVAPPNVSLTGVSCPSATTCIAVGAGSILTRSAGGHWTVQAAPHPQGVKELAFTGIDCPTTTHCVAVGTATYQHPALGFVETWNGTSWHFESPSVINQLQLAAVSCAYAGSCTAVGNDFTGEESAITLANGVWTNHPVPNAYPSYGGYLQSVSCATARSCLAVGTLGVRGGSAALAASWDGTAWTNVPVPDGDNVGSLTSVRCLTTKDCFALGVYGDGLLDLRWNGTALTPFNQTFSDAPLAGINFTLARCSTQGCQMLGSTWNGQGLQPAAARFTKTTGVTHALPLPAGQSAGEVVAASCFKTLCTAVGSAPPSYLQGPSVPLIERFDGTSWNLESVG